jgi:hypothetical protein
MTESGIHTLSPHYIRHRVFEHIDVVASTFNVESWTMHMQGSELAPNRVSAERVCVNHGTCSFA